MSLSCKEVLENTPDRHQRPPDEAPLAPSADGENRPVLRDDRGRFVEGTRPGPGRHPLIESRESFRREAAKAFTPETHAKAITGFVEEVLARRPWALKVYFDLFGDDPKAIFQGQTVTIKVIQGVSEDAL